MNTLFLCGRGSNQVALAHRLNACQSLSHIAVVEPARQAKRRPVLPRLASLTVARPLRKAWLDMARNYDRLFPDLPAGVPSSVHPGANSESVRDLVGAMRPDMVLVSGTDLLQQPLIDLMGRHGRVMNLHTGLSPYVRGGPNCTNWALALGGFDLIGNTVMWIDAGIDSGNLVATERTPLDGRETLGQLHLKVMEHAHDLYCRAYRRAADGDELPSVPQASIAKGRLFLSKDWTAGRMLEAVTNFRNDYRPEALRPRDLPLVDL